VSVDLRVNRISAISGHMHRLEVRRMRRGAHSLIWLQNVQKLHVLRSLKFFFRWVPMVLEIGK
jgi:hypothetical protein